MTKLSSIHKLLAITKKSVSGILIVAVLMASVALFTSASMANAEETTVTVTVVKYVDERMATLDSANSTDFQMISSWKADNIGSGSGEYALSLDNEIDYTAVTTEMSVGADYSTHEVMNDTTGLDCDAGKPFALQGYSVGVTLEEAKTGPIRSSSPEFTNLTSDQYVIVWNENCSSLNDEDDEEDSDEGEGGEIGGEVESEAVNAGTLEVTEVATLDSTATADGTYENGWEYVFHVTVPQEETDLAMKFGNWEQTSGGGKIAAANNITISSDQASNDGDTLIVTEANTYTRPMLHITDDLDPTIPGLQVEVRVKVAVPTGTLDGSYTTTYGIRTE